MENEYEIWYWFDDPNDGLYYYSSDDLSTAKSYCRKCFSEHKPSLVHVINSNNEVEFELKR